MGSPVVQKVQAQSCISLLTMEDHGLARLEELTVIQKSTGATSVDDHLKEIIDILANLAASLRDGE
jgi:hypothetical protein